MCPGHGPWPGNVCSFGSRLRSLGSYTFAGTTQERAAPLECAARCADQRAVRTEPLKAAQTGAWAANLASRIIVSQEVTAWRSRSDLPVRPFGAFLSRVRVRTLLAVRVWLEARAGVFTCRVLSMPGYFSASSGNVMGMGDAKNPQAKEPYTILWSASGQKILDRG